MLLEFCIQDAAGHFGAEPMYRVADRAFDAMVERSLMTAEQAATTVVPIYCRTEEEVRRAVRLRATGRFAESGGNQRA